MKRKRRGRSRGMVDKGSSRKEERQRAWSKRSRRLQDDEGGEDGGMAAAHDAHDASIVEAIDPDKSGISPDKSGNGPDKSGIGPDISGNGPQNK